MKDLFWSVFWITVVVGLLQLPGMVFADESATPTFAGALTAQEGYIHPLLSRELHRAWAARAATHLHLQSGLEFGGWQSVALEHETPTAKMTDEGHLEVGFAGTVCETQVRVSSGVHTMPIMNDLLEQTLDWDVAPAWSFGDSETWTLRMRVAWVSASSFSDGAAVVQPHVVHDWEGAFGCPVMNLHQEFVVSWDDGFEGMGFRNRARGIFLRYEAGISWRMGEQTSLVLPEFVGLFPLRAGHDGRGQETEIRFGFRYTF